MAHRYKEKPKAGAFAITKVLPASALNSAHRFDYGACSGPGASASTAAAGFRVEYQRPGSTGDDWADFTGAS